MQEANVIFHVMSIIGAFFAGFGALFIVLERRKRARFSAYPTLEARVNGYELVAGDDEAYGVRVRYSYRVEGRDYDTGYMTSDTYVLHRQAKKRLDNFRTRYPEGVLLTIRYNPDKPGESMPEFRLAARSFPIGWLFLGFGTMALFIGSGILLFGRLIVDA